MSAEYKQCRKCHQLKLAGEFYKKRNECNACRAAYNAAYLAANLAANRERIAAYNAAYRAANRERRNAHSVAYYAANRERLIDYKAASRDGKIKTRTATYFFQTLQLIGQQQQSKQQ